jgi:DNA-3-methyladenine glycosylase
MIDHSKADNMPLLPKNVLTRDAAELAPDLIGCYLFTTIGSKRSGGMIIETEAYDENDPFAHCHVGASSYSRNQAKPMTFAPGNAYIYRSGQLHCLNFVCGPSGLVAPC